MKTRAFIAVAALVLAGCTPDWAKQNSSTLLMRVTDILASPGASGGASGTPGAILHSDVCCGIINDSASIGVELFRKNPLAPSVPAEDVVLTQYQVRYFRTDGHNVEGIDVPFRITGPLNLRIHAPSGEGESAGTAVIDIVRNQAKVEPPLVNLRNASAISANSPGQTLGGGELFITVVAEITIFGESSNGHALQATGQIQITFSDFAGNG